MSFILNNKKIHRNDHKMTNMKQLAKSSFKELFQLQSKTYRKTIIDFKQTNKRRKDTLEKEIQEIKYSVSEKNQKTTHQQASQQKAGQSIYTLTQGLMTDPT